MLSGAQSCQAQQLRRNGVCDSGSLQLSSPVPVAIVRHESVASCLAGSLGANTGCPHRLRCSVVAKMSAQLLGVLSPPAGPSTSATSGEALRPRRFSAPLMARLIRSTTTVQELADFIQQQSQYFDPAHVGIAFLHLALLTSQQQQQRAQQAAQGQGQRPEADTPTSGASATTSEPATGVVGPGARSSTLGSKVPGWPLVNGTGAGPSGRAQPLEGRPAAGDGPGLSGTVSGAYVDGADDGGFLSMASILDDEEDEGGGGGGSDSGREGGSAAWADRDAGTTVGARSSDAAGTEAATEGLGTNGSNGNGNENGGPSGGQDHLAASLSDYADAALDFAEAAEAAEAASSALLDAAAAAVLPPAADLDPDAPSRVVTADPPTSATPSTSISAAHPSSSGESSRTQSKTTATSSTMSTSSATRDASNNGASSLAAPAAAGQANGASAVPGVPASLSPAPLSPAPAPHALALRSLLLLAFANLESLSGPDLAAVLSSLAVLRYGDKAVVDRLVQALAPKLFGCRPQDISNSLCALALLDRPPSLDVRTAFLSAVKKQVRSFSPRDLALTMWAYGAAGTDVKEDAVLLLLDSSRKKLALFGPLHLAKMAQGLAALRYRPQPEWLDLFSQALRPSLRRISSRELCALLLALASLQVGLDDTTRATLLVHTLSVLPSLAPSELALSLWALGRLTAAGAPALIDLDMSGRVLDVTFAQLGAFAFSGGELQQLLEGLTRLALQPPLEWMQAFVAALQPQLLQLDARQLSGVLSSLAAQQYRPMPEMQQVVLEATQVNMQQLLADTTCTSALITALRRLNIEPPPSWVGALLEASRPALKNRCSDLHLANLAGSLAAWGVRPDGRWAARLMWRSQVLMAENRMSPRALVALLQAMTSMAIRPNEVWVKLCLRAASARAAQPSFQPQHYCTLMAALHALGVKPPQWWLSQMLLSTYRCWDGFNMSHWSTLLPALVLLEARVPREWLRRLEATTGPRLADCSALQLLTLVVSLHQLRRQQQAALPEGLPPAVIARYRGRLRQLEQEHRASGERQQGLAAATVGGRLQEGAGEQVAAAASVAADTVGVAAAATTAPVTAAEAALTGQPVPLPTPDDSVEASAAALALQESNLVAAEAGSSAGSGGGTRPGPAWLGAWWSASTGLLTRVRYAPSELELTAGWLTSLGLRPTPEWLKACADVAERYGKVMGPEERQQLAASVLPLVQLVAAPAEAAEAIALQATTEAAADSQAKVKATTDHLSK